MRAGWQRKQIGDLCEVIAGQSPEGKFYNADGNGMPFYQGKKDFGKKFIEAPTTWTTQTTKIAREGDILMSVRAPVGPVNFATDEVCIGRGLAAIRSRAELNRDFLFYQLLHLQPEIAGREGAVFSSINKAEIEALPLAFASLPEQQRIVGILDEAFDGIATAKANAEQNLQNARALFESHLQSVFTRKGYATGCPEPSAPPSCSTQRGEGWVVKRLDDACDLITCGVAAKPHYVDVGVPFLSAKNVKRGEIVWSGYNCVSKKTHDELTKNNKPLRGDVLYTRVGSYGEAAVIEEDIEFSVFVSLTLIKPIKDLLNNYYLKYYLNSSEVKELAKRSISSSGVGNLNVGTVREFPIHLPSLTEQATIVAKLNEISAETQRLESLYQRKLAALDELKKSLLHQAFSGAL